MHFIHSHSQKEKVAKKKEERPTIYFLSSPTTTARKTTTALMKLHDILTCLNYTTFLNGLDTQRKILVIILRYGIKYS